ASGREIGASPPAEGDVVIASGVALQGAGPGGGVAKAGTVVNQRCNPIRRIATSGSVEEGESSGSGVVVGCRVGKERGEPDGGVVHARGVVEKGVESERTVLGALIFLQCSVPEGRVLGGCAADCGEQNGEKKSKGAYL